MHDYTRKNKIIIFCLAAGFLVLFSYQNCSQPLMQMSTGQTTKANDLSNMLNASEHEIEMTKDDLGINHPDKKQSKISNLDRGSVLRLKLKRAPAAQKKKQKYKK